MSMSLKKNDQASAVCSWSDWTFGSKYGKRWNQVKVKCNFFMQLLVSDIQPDDFFRLSSRGPAKCWQKIKKKKIKQEIWAVRKIREQLYINMFWLVPGPKAEPQGVLEEVVPLQKDTEIFREPHWRLQSHVIVVAIITQDKLQWLASDSARFTLRCEWFLQG